MSSELVFVCCFLLMKCHSRKKLVGLKLIKTQLFQRTVDQERHSPVTQLLHLPRFFSIFKPRYVTWTERVVEYLKSRPNYSASYAEARTLFDESLRMSFRRLVKHSLFNKFISPDGVSSMIFGHVNISHEI